MKIQKIMPYLLLLFCVNLPALAEDITFKQAELTIQTAQGARHFSIELATTPAQQELGLMHRTVLAADHGMLFLWPGDREVAMWMKDTLLPLDMLFIDSHGKIVYIAANAKPESLDLIKAGQPVRAVMEMSGNNAAIQGIKVGDQVNYPAFLE